MSRRLAAVLAAFLVFATFAAACGDDDDTDAVTGTDTSVTEPDAVGAEVTIAGFAYSPASLEVEAGATVTFTNDDGAPHTVTAGEPGAQVEGFDERVDGGETARVSFDEPGTYPYFCRFHPNMTGEIVVS